MAYLAVACGIVTAAGAVLPWISADGARPATGVRYTSLPQMLVYTLDNDSPFVASVGMAVVLLGALIVIGARTGSRTLTVLAAVFALATGGMWIGLTEHHFRTPDLPNIHYLNPANLPWHDLQLGAWMTIGGSLLALLSAFALRRPASGSSHAA